MPRTDFRQPDKWLSSFLLELLRSLLSSWSLPILLALLGLQRVILPALGASVAGSGLVYLIWVRVQRSLLARIGDSHAPIAVSNLTFAYCWVGVGLLLTLLGAFSLPPLLVAAVGTLASLVLHRLAGWGGSALIARRARDKRRLPARARRSWSFPKVAFLLNLTLLFLSYVCIAYAGLVAINIFGELTPKSEDEGPPPKSKVDPKHNPPSPPPSSSPSFPGPTKEEERDPTYADLCSRPRNPLAIGYGLGKLFEEAGAVFAGCGRQAIEVGEHAWVAPGFCGPELRSLAVVGGTHEPVLLYGTSARVTWQRALARELSFADVAEAEGEVVLLGVGDGTAALVRTSPALRTDSKHPNRCGEVEVVPGAFVELPAPLTALWLEHMRLWRTWAWPEGDPRSDDVVFSSIGLEPAYGSCDEKGLVCRLDGPGEHVSREAPATVTITELEAWMPRPPSHGKARPL